MEEPCSKTGRPCEFIWDWNDADMFCTDCFKYRDFSLDECESDLPRVAQTQEESPCGTGEVAGSSPASGVTYNGQLDVYWIANQGITDNGVPVK